MTLCILTTDSYNFWNLILQTFIGLAIVATFVVYYFQLQTMKSASFGQNMLSIIELLQDTEVRTARRIVLQKLKGTDYNNWTDDDKKAASKVCSTYDTVSILVYQQKIVSDDSFLENWGSSIKDCYIILEPYIKSMQAEKSSNYWNDFKVLYDKFKS